jgi:hypothetical protein
MANSNGSQNSAPEGPPSGTYDPSIEAQRRAAERGLEDLLRDLGIQKKTTKQDAGVEQRTLALQLARGLADARRERQRGILSLNQRRGDLRLDARRGREDLGMRLANLARNYKTLGSQQTQQQNAAGVLDGGTANAAAHRREANMAVERQPIDIAGGRLEQDLSLGLGRLDTSETQLREDVHRSRHELRQDTGRQSRQAQTALERALQQLRLQKQRGIREQRIGDADLIQSELWDAKQRHLAGF